MKSIPYINSYMDNYDDLWIYWLSEVSIFYKNNNKSFEFGNKGKNLGYSLNSIFLSNKDASSLLMIGTGALSTNLIKAHVSVRPIKSVFIWGRNFEKATAICNKLKNKNFTIHPIRKIEEKISKVDIISCATLSKIPLVKGKYLRNGQHIDLVGAYKKDMKLLLGLLFF